MNETQRSSMMGAPGKPPLLLRLLISLFWLTATIVSVLMYYIFDGFFLEPRPIQQKFLGTTVSPTKLRAQMTAFGMEGGTTYVWTYEISESDATRFRARCNGPTEMYGYDAWKNSKNSDVPLPACTVTRGIIGDYDIRIDLAGNLLLIGSSNDRVARSKVK